MCDSLIKLGADNVFGFTECHVFGTDFVCVTFVFDVLFPGVLGTGDLTVTVRNLATPRI